MRDWRKFQVREQRFFSWSGYGVLLFGLYLLITAFVGDDKPEARLAIGVILMFAGLWMITFAEVLKLEMPRKKQVYLRNLFGQSWMAVIYEDRKGKPIAAPIEERSLELLHDGFPSRTMLGAPYYEKHKDSRGSAPIGVWLLDELYLVPLGFQYFKPE